ncbi:MAG TPA: hypothetical protein VFW62_07880, partial [bacterium]|nr:hypothetical protein [bacterium]
LVSLGTGAALLLVGFMATMVFGNVMGTEFCPDTFERRGFAFREIPFLGVQISSIDRRTDIGSVESHILGRNYITSTVREPKTWHLVKLWRFRGTSATGDAALLMSYLDARDEKKGDHAWVNWSEAHPDLAKVLWPAVAKAAQDNNYLVVPDLFSAARASGTAAELKGKLEAILAPPQKAKLTGP